VIGHRRLFVSVSSCPNMILHISLFEKLNHNNGWMNFKPVQRDSLFRFVSLDEWMGSYVISVNSRVNTKADTMGIIQPPLNISHCNFCIVFGQNDLKKFVFAIKIISIRCP